MTDTARTLDAFVGALPLDRGAAVRQVWDAVRASMPPGFTETIGPKFFSFSAGAEQYVALANQKGYISLYLVPIYVYPELKAQLDASPKQVRCGKSCINFKRADELPLDTIGAIIAAHDADTYLADVHRIRAEAKQQRRARQS
jgi:hypothetical protein